jgi:cytochrome c oxidase subunit 6b
MSNTDFKPTNERRVLSFLRDDANLKELFKTDSDDIFTQELRTTPRDKRFPAVNQAGHCFNRYNEWLVCLKQTNGNQLACSRLRQFANSICPSDWTDKWDEQREEGTFAGVQV